MATGTALGKIGKIDFFACLPSGAFALLSLYLTCFIVLIYKKSGEAKEEYIQNETLNIIVSAFHELIKYTNTYATSILLIIFVAYLLGSIFRAIPVDIAEDIDFGKRIYKFIHKEKPDLFPYLENILRQDQFVTNSLTISSSQVSKQLESLFTKNLSKSANLNEKNQQRKLKDIYNYWKVVICINSLEGFIYYQEYEARSRLFSSMVISGIFSLLLTVAAYLFYTFPISHSLNSISWILLSGIFISLIMIATFSYFTRRVRALEVSTLTGLYLAHIHRILENK